MPILSSVSSKESIVEVMSKKNTNPILIDEDNHPEDKTLNIGRRRVLFKV